jgi:hypothetical protein
MCLALNGIEQKIFKHYSVLYAHGSVGPITTLEIEVRSACTDHPVVLTNGAMVVSNRKAKKLTSLELVSGEINRGIHGFITSAACVSDSAFINNHLIVEGVIPEDAVVAYGRYGGDINVVCMRYNLFHVIKYRFDSIPKSYIPDARGETLGKVIAAAFNVIIKNASDEISKNTRMRLTVKIESHAGAHPGFDVATQTLTLVRRNKRLYYPIKQLLV